VTHSRYKVGYDAGFAAGLAAMERVIGSIGESHKTALRLQTANNHLARHGGSAVDWGSCPMQSCVDARAALLPRPDAEGET
jgi:hypothetical protein